MRIPATPRRIRRYATAMLRSPYTAAAAVVSLVCGITANVITAHDRPFCDDSQGYLVIVNERHLTLVHVLGWCGLMTAALGGVGFTAWLTHKLMKPGPHSRWAYPSSVFLFALVAIIVAGLNLLAVHTHHHVPDCM